MLPAGFGADIAPVAEQARFRQLLPGAQAVTRLRIGACACALWLAVDPARSDERQLRRRYAALGLSRERIIATLDRHCRSRPAPRDPAAWRSALAGFVAEHARNAGPSFYALGFGPEPSHALATLEGRTTTSAAGVRSAADSWLVEGTVIEVTR
jgi:hypothetical protein